MNIIDIVRDDMSIIIDKPIVKINVSDIQLSKIHVDILIPDSTIYLNLNNKVFDWDNLSIKFNDSQNKCTVFVIVSESENIIQLKEFDNIWIIGKILVPRNVSIYLQGWTLKCILFYSLRIVKKIAQDVLSFIKEDELINNG